MATPTLGGTPTIIDSAESTSAWGGDSFTLEPDIKVAGSNSVACVQTGTGANDVYVSGSWNFSTDVHLRLWFNITYIGNLAASNKCQVFLYDGSNTAYWTYNAGETYSGGWEQAVIYTGDTPTSGSVTKSSITRIGIRFNTSSKPRNVPANAWYDQWTYGDGFYVTGGSSGDPITWSGIAALDKASAYNIVSEVNGVIFLAGKVTIGNGATATYLQDYGGVLVYKNLQVSSTLYQIIGAGSGCDIEIAGGVVTAAGSQNYVFDMDEANLNSFIMSGKQLSKASAVYFKAGQDVQNNVFDNCGQVVPTTATFKYNTLSNYVGSTGALLFPSDGTNLTDCSFINCDNAVEYGSGSDTSDPTFNALTFDDVSGNYDVNNTSGGAVSISKTNGANPNSYNPGGSSVTFTASFTHTLTGLVENTEVTYVRVSDGVELFHVENVTATGQTVYTHSGGETVDILIVHLVYDPDISNIYNLTLPNADASVPIKQIADAYYENPA